MNILIALSFVIFSTVSFAQEQADNDIKNRLIQVESCDVNPVTLVNSNTGRVRRSVERKFDSKSYELCLKKGYTDFRLFNIIDTNYCRQANVLCESPAQVIDESGNERIVRFKSCDSNPFTSSNGSISITGTKVENKLNSKSLKYCLGMGYSSFERSQIIESESCLEATVTCKN